MRSVVAVYVALAASSHSTLGLTVVSSFCDGLDERPVRVVGVAGLFCVPLRPCEGSVNSATNELLACPREGQRDVLKEVELMTDTCCAVVDSDSGALGCVLVGAEGRRSMCLSSANWPREINHVRLSRRRTRSRRMQNVADSSSPTGLTQGTTRVAPPPVVTTNSSVATTTFLASTTPLTPAVTTPSTPAVTTPSTPVATTPLIPAVTTPLTPLGSATAPLATPVANSSVPVNSSSVPVVIAPAPLAAAPTGSVPVSFSLISVLTPGTPNSTIDTGANDTFSDSSSSSGSGSTDSPPVITTAPLTLAPLCTAGSDCNNNGGLLLEVSSANSSGPRPAADGSLGPASNFTPAADVEVSELAGSLPASELISNGSIPISTVRNSSATRSNSMGSVVNLSNETTGTSINGSLALSPETTLAETNSNSGSADSSDSGLIAGNPATSGSLANLGSISVESSPEDNVASKSPLARSPSSESDPSSSPSSSPILTPVPVESPWSKGVLQLTPITDDDTENSVSPPPSTDGGGDLPPVTGANTEEKSNALGLNVILFITVGSVLTVALIFGIFYLRPKRAIIHELLTPEPPRPIDRTGAYPYDHSLDLESTGPYDATSTPRVSR